MIPGWVPEVAATYLAHVSQGLALRELARAKGCHASTVLRQVRRVEALRDDPLVDEALDRVAKTLAVAPAPTADNKEKLMARPLRATGQCSDQRIDREARRILRRLCEKGAFLAVAPTMEKAVVLREVVPGRTNRIAVVDREVAHAFALQEWISCDKAGKIACYSITAVGRAALKRLLTEERNAERATERAERVAERSADRAADRAGPRAVQDVEGFAEAQTPFQAQHRFFAERTVMADDGSGERRLRFNLAESPLSVLGRKRDKCGTAYLAADLIEAGERLREDFEMAQMGPRVTQNWDKFLTAGSDRGIAGARGPAEGPADARGRVAKAMEALGPGLSDIVFRICCFLEGLETAEKRLGWSARSGKVVLKIALERLAVHYGIAPVETRRRAG